MDRDLLGDMSDLDDLPEFDGELDDMDPEEELDFDMEDIREYEPEDLNGDSFNIDMEEPPVWDEE